MNRAEFLKRCKELNITNNVNIHDFLATCGEVEEFHESKTYFYKRVKMFAFVELRLHKVSQRVSTSKNLTK